MGCGGLGIEARAFSFLDLKIIDVASSLTCEVVVGAEGVCIGLHDGTVAEILPPDKELTVWIGLDKKFDAKHTYMQPNNS